MGCQLLIVALCTPVNICQRLRRRNRADAHNGNIVLVNENYIGGQV